MPIVMTLKYGLVAAVVVDDTDRPAYVPPPVAHEDHAATCRCPSCVALARVKGK